MKKLYWALLGAAVLALPVAFQIVQASGIQCPGSCPVCP